MLVKELSADKQRKCHMGVDRITSTNTSSKNGLTSISIVNLEPISFAVFVVKSSKYLTTEAWWGDNQCALLVISEMRD